MSNRKTEIKAETKTNNQSPNQNETQPQKYTKSDVIRARAIISAYRETQKSRPKRKCSEKQLAALAAGREKNGRLKGKTNTK